MGARCDTRVNYRTFKKSLRNYLNSGWHFSPEEYHLKYRFHFINSIFLVAFVALTQGIVFNSIKGYVFLVYFEIFMFAFFMGCIYVLRLNKAYYDRVIDAIAVLSIVLFNALIIVTKPEDITIIWCFFYVVSFMFLMGHKKGLYWIIAFLSSLLLVQFLPFFETYLDIARTLLLIFVLSIVTATTYFFQLMIERGFQTIIRQNDQLQEQMATIKEQEKLMLEQSRLAAMGEMVRMIAHQWRQPLSTATLRISNHQISQMLDGKNRRSSDQILDEINETLTYLSETIDDFQNYFKPDSALGSCDLQECLRQSLDFLEPRFKHERIRVDLTCNDTCEVRANANELKQILMNLLNNAVDAIMLSHQDSGVIAISTEDHEERICIIIEDNGIGLDVGAIDKLFEPYYSTKGKNGTGLGLYMSKMIVEKHFGGSISAESRHQGTAFKLSLFKCDV